MAQKKKTGNRHLSKTGALPSQQNNEQVPALPKGFEKLPDETKIAYLEAQSFQGPLPPPSLFGQYDQILPGSADRILSLAEKEQAHRQKWESEVLNAQKSEISRGQWMGFGLSIFALTIAFLCAYFGFPIVATVCISTVLVGIVTAFLRGRSNKEKESQV